MKENDPDWEGFSRAIMDQHFLFDDLEGDVRHKLALKFNLIVQIDGGFDPENQDHRDGDEYGAEKGDAWFKYNFSTAEKETT